MTGEVAFEIKVVVYRIIIIIIIITLFKCRTEVLIVDTVNK